MLIAVMIYRAEEVHTPVLSQVLVHKKKNEPLYRSAQVKGNGLQGLHNSPYVKETRRFTSPD